MYIYLLSALCLPECDTCKRKDHWLVRHLTDACQNIWQTKHVNKATLYYRASPYRAVNIPQQDFKNKSINAVW
jgi:hypothetical protein